MNDVLKFAKNAALITIGTVSLVVGIAGVILPFFPGTPFLFLSAACFGAVEW